MAVVRTAGTGITEHNITEQEINHWQPLTWG